MVSVTGVALPGAKNGKSQTVNGVLDAPSVTGQGASGRQIAGNDRLGVCRLQVARREARTSTRPGGSPKRLQPTRARGVVARARHQSVRHARPSSGYRVGERYGPGHG